MYKLIISFALCLCISCENKGSVGRSLNIQDSIFDETDLLTTDQEDSIFLLIRKLDQQIGSQIAIVTIESLEGQKIEDFSINFFDSLKFGRATHNDGVLITVSRNDRQIRIDVGTGLENILKDEIAAQIIRELLAPKFREGKFGLGLFLAVEKISKLIVDNKELVGLDPK